MNGLVSQCEPQKTFKKQGNNSLQQSMKTRHENQTRGNKPRSLCLHRPASSPVTAPCHRINETSATCHTTTKHNPSGVTLTGPFRGPQRAPEGPLLVDADVSGGADAARGQRLEDDGGVQAGQARAAHVWLDVDPPEAQLGRPPHGVHREEFLGSERSKDKAAR